MAAALGAELHVVSAYEPLRGARIVGAPDAAAKVWAPQPDAEVQTTLGEAAASVRARDVKVTTHAVSKDPVDALLDVAAEVGAEMIVVGNKGMHGAQALLECYRTHHRCHHHGPHADKPAQLAKVGTRPGNHAIRHIDGSREADQPDGQKCRE